jgi:hypothetical protein
MEPATKIPTINPNQEYINEITGNLLCAVCLQLSDPPLFSCHNGHFTCSGCISRLPGNNMKTKICPHCRDNGFIRNIPYEKMAEAIYKNTDLDCPFVDEGCQVKYKFGQQKEHLKYCRFFSQKYNCPCANCPETGCRPPGRKAVVLLHLQSVGTAPAVVRGASTPTTERRQQSGLC